MEMSSPGNSKHKQQGVMPDNVEGEAEK